MFGCFSLLSGGGGYHRSMEAKRIANNHDIAIDLCRRLEKELNAKFYHTGTIFSADQIELRSFADVMVLLLHLKSERDWAEFVDKVNPYIGFNMRDIEGCDVIYDEFLKLIGE